MENVSSVTTSLTLLIGNVYAHQKAIVQINIVKGTTYKTEDHVIYARQVILLKKANATIRHFLKIVLNGTKTKLYVLDVRKIISLIPLPDNVSYRSKTVKSMDRLVTVSHATKDMGFMVLNAS